MTTLTTRHPIAVATPRAAAWAAAAWIAVSRLGIQLQAYARQRDERGTVIGRVSEANRLRHVAQGFMSSDPRFAADLFAAADRHERAE
jgi:hypothetical protein